MFFGVKESIRTSHTCVTFTADDLEIQGHVMLYVTFNNFSFPGLKTSVNSRLRVLGGNNISGG